MYTSEESEEAQKALFVISSPLARLTTLGLGSSSIVDLVHVLSRLELQKSSDERAEVAAHHRASEEDIVRLDHSYC